ncbi:hypothetical protein QBC40DRAFT_283502 [Triangularia verruculosa]|uniref:Uncharacterized protein n=1 Tax=Triangularia verruculosa TaxID=2587418 RepID=A0AAN6XHE2_9PEZI|nr:hypothetical protein QBC40DRAFT_283502 [Triangularia verruculosa]
MLPAGKSRWHHHSHRLSGTPDLSPAQQISSDPASDQYEHDEHDEEDRSERGASHSKLAADRRRRGPSSGGEDEYVAMADPEPTRQYCTQACLLGLKRGRGLDEKCPNVSLHRLDGSSRALAGYSSASARARKQREQATRKHGLEAHLRGCG